MSDISRRSFLRGLAALTAVALIPVQIFVRRTRLVIASRDSSLSSKLAADLVTDGRNDAAVIQKAVDSMAKGGSVVMLGGTFYLDKPIDLTGTKDSVIVGNRFEGAGIVWRPND